MKRVYLAEDLRLGARRCVLAEMVDSFTNEETQQVAAAAFEREADMLAALRYEHIPKVYDRFASENRHYLVMEYIEGITLEERIKQEGGKLSEAETVHIALQIAESLEYLHGCSPPIVFRDLKPSNVMVEPGDYIKLVDFGIARHFQPERTATLVGTPGYAPPEQYRGKVEPRSDLYALGAIMHYALSGRDPAGEPPFSFPPLTELAAEVTYALAQLVSEALAYRLEDRVASATEFKRRLLAIRPRSTDTAPSAVARSPTSVTRDRSPAPQAQPVHKSLFAPRTVRFGLGFIFSAVLAVGVGLTVLRLAYRQPKISPAVRPQKPEARASTPSPVESYLTAAERGDASAQKALGEIYYSGKGIARSDGEAAKWFLRAAEQGNADAQYRIARMYYDGRGVGQNRTQAANWFGKAAEQGVAEAQDMLGRMYEYGEGVGRNDSEAAKWFLKAAEQQNADGEYHLGRMYFFGHGVPHDHAEAIKWLGRSATQNDAVAQDLLGRIYENGEGTARDYAQAITLFRKAAEQGSAEAEYDLGRMYYYGRGAPHDHAAAAKWFRKAADQGNADAQNMLARIH